MKRILSVFLIFTLLLPLAACGTAPTDPTPALPTESDPTRPPDGVATDDPAPKPEPVPENAAAELLAAPEYPECVPFPQESDYFTMESLSGGSNEQFEKYNAARSAWLESVNERRAIATGTGLDDFYRKAAPLILGDETENRVLSPLNLYLALAMLAEVTDGNTRAQLLDLLGAHDIEAVRTQADALWRMNYSDDGFTTTLLGSSLWLSDRIRYVQSTVDTLAEKYRASVFRGTMGSPSYTKMLQDWLNEQTGGLLQEAAGKQEFDADTVAALATTIYFKARWSKTFPEGATMPAIFKTQNGELKCDFMHSSGTDTYYWGEDFGAVRRGFESSDCAMWFILPDEGKTPQDLLKEGTALELAISDNWENRKTLQINLSVPKFDVSSDLDLVEDLKKLGITDAFNPFVSDFTPLETEDDLIYVNKVTHAARIKVDEEGCEAAAFTVIMMKAGAAMPPEDKMDFVLDRPFLLVITGVNRTPLFVASVQTPVE